VRIAASAALIFSLFFHVGYSFETSSIDGSSASADGVILQMGDGCYLMANEVGYRDGIGEATGSIRLYFGDGILLAEKLYYALDSGSMWGEDIRFKLKNIYVKADEVESAELDGTRRIVLRHGRIYSGEPGRHAPNIAAETITIPGSAAAWIDGASVRIGNWRIFSMGRWRLKLDGIAMCFRGKYGYGRDFGICGRNGIVCTLKSKGVVGLNFDFFSKRGFLVGPCCRFCGDSKEAGTRVDILSGFISDGGNRGFDLLGAPIETRRAFFNCRYGREFSDSWALSAALYRWSDSFALRDFRPEKYWNNQYPLSHIELTHRREKSLTTATLRLDPNDFQTGTKELEELRYQIIPQQLLDLPVIGQGDISFVGRRIESEKYSDEKSFADGFFALSAPLRWRDVLSIRPVAAVRSMVAAEKIDQHFPSQTIWQAGFDFNVLVSGHLDMSVPRWDIESMRHRMTAMVHYRRGWCERCGWQCRDEIFPDGNLPVIDVGEAHDPEHFPDGHCLRLGLENIIQAKSLARGSMRTLVEANVYEDLRPWSSGGGCGKSDIYSTLRVMPAEFFSMKIFSRTDIHSFAVNELRLETELHDGNIFEMSFGGDYIRHSARQYSFGFVFRPTSRSQLGGSIRYDTHLHRVTAQRHHFFHRFDRNWSMDIRLTVRASATGVERRNIRIGLHLDY
jgi:hypothetical protein